MAGGIPTYAHANVRTRFSYLGIGWTHCAEIWCDPIWPNVTQYLYTQVGVSTYEYAKLGEFFAIQEQPTGAEISFPFGARICECPAGALQWRGCHATITFYELSIRLLRSLGIEVGRAAKELRITAALISFARLCFTTTSRKYITVFRNPVVTYSLTPYIHITQVMPPQSTYKAAYDLVKYLTLRYLREQWVIKSSSASYSLLVNSFGFNHFVLFRR